MQGFVRGTGREAILIGALIAVAWFGDWSDDCFSYHNAARSHSFEYANGTPQTLQGGRTMGFSNVFQPAMLLGPTEKPKVNKTALESVYGDSFGVSKDKPGAETEASTTLLGGKAAMQLRDAASWSSPSPGSSSAPVY